MTKNKGQSQLWKILLGVLAAVSGLVLLLLIAVVSAIYVPALREAVVEKAVAITSEKTGMDIDVGDIYLSPVHHSPMLLYRAYKGKADLPMEVRIDSLFIGHRGQDTLLYTKALRLKALLKTGEGQGFSDFTSIPIVVDALSLSQTTLHSDTLIAAVGIDAVVGALDVRSPELQIAKGQFPLHGLRIDDTSVGITVRDTPSDTTDTDTTATLMAFEVPDGELRNFRFLLKPQGLDVSIDTLFVNALADVGASKYDVRQISAGGPCLQTGSLSLPFDTLYGNACVDLSRSMITSKGLHARSAELGAEANLETTALDLETMQVDVRGDADFRGSKARLRASYDIDDEAYNANIHIEKVDLSSFLSDNQDVVLTGDIEAVGQGINPKQHLSSRVKVRLDEAQYGQFNFSHTTLEASTDRTTAVTLKAPALRADLSSPMPLFKLLDRLQPLIAAVTDTAIMNSISSLQDLRQVETIRKRIPPLKADINLSKGSPLQPVLDNKGIDIEKAVLALRTDSLKVNIDLNKAQLGQIQLSQTTLAASTDSITSLAVLTQGVKADFYSPMSLFALASNLQPLLNALNDTVAMGDLKTLKDLTVLDTLHRLIPDLRAGITLSHGSPVQHIIEQKGLDIETVGLSMSSDQQQTGISLNVSIPEINHQEDSTALRLPAAKARMRVNMTEGKTTASLVADSRLTDGAMSLHKLSTDATLRMDIKREQNTITGNGRLALDSIVYNDANLGNRAVNMEISPSKEYEHALRADIRLDDLPVELVNSFVSLPDIALHGAVRGQAAVDGLPQKTDISAKVLPLGVSAEYQPYDVTIGLGQTPIEMEHSKVDLNGIRLYGADSTFITLTGGLDLEQMQLNVVLEADSFAPTKLPQGGKIPVYGELATDIKGTITGSLDSILANVDVTILPTTDITYPIDKKNLAQVNPYGTVNVRYALADSVPLQLGGQVNVDNGIIRYSPKAYPIMPFKVDSGSNVTFDGPVGRTLLNVSASQKVKADVQSEGEETRRVDFTTGVRVNGVLDSIGLNSIGFFLEAPADETITQELVSLDEDTREGLAATLLATGMYVGESNAAQHKEGYALSSIINSRINAAMANSKMGKVVDIDLSSAQTEHAAGKSNDMNISISKSFFQDRFRITVGSAISDNPEVNKTGGLLQNLTADYKLTSDGKVLLRLFSQRDYNNVLEGELYKSGLGVRAMQEWRRRESYEGDSITRTYDLTADAGVSYRSNNSIGPDLTLKSSIKNMMGNGETFTIKGNGAYYWALRNRFPGDPKKTDTYKFGISTSLVLPYLHWAGEDNPQGDTRYMFGYQYENIAGGYGVHKITGGFTYFFRSENSPYITHALTPFSLSVVMMKAESDSLLDKAAEYPQLIKVIAGNEFVPSISYNFIYNDYRAKRTVNTMLDLGVKESGNLINAIYCAFGHAWDEKNKALGSTTFNQFVKLTAELRNKFNLTDKVAIATRLYAGANIPIGNSQDAPLSEAFYAGGSNGMRAASPYAYGPGNFYSAKYNQNFFHAGDVKLEANFELRFPIVWKIYGATFIDAGNVWSWYSMRDRLDETTYQQIVTAMQLPDNLYDGILNNPDLLKQIALGTGAGLRLDLDGLVIRLDIGVAIHSPYQTYQYNKETWKPDTSQPITNYFNIPSALDAIRVNFGIGYPF